MVDYELQEIRVDYQTKAIYISISYKQACNEIPLMRVLLKLKMLQMNDNTIKQERLITGPAQFHSHYVKCQTLDIPTLRIMDVNLYNNTSDDIKGYIVLLICYLCNCCVSDRDSSHRVPLLHDCGEAKKAILLAVYVYL